MSGAARFRAAVEAGDLDALMDSLADEVVLHSPATFRPREGKDAVRRLLRIIMDTFEDFRYTDQVEGSGISILVFRARVGERQVEGIDLLRFDPGGRVEDFTVMVRPLSALVALAEAVGPRLVAADGGAGAAGE
ncbi:MAG: nuclear transport factor 2 family protein [Acidobacteria bacterium]|nr:nuclear transport factor 2 family protein [Acidobacteriota bacterium]